MCKLQHRCIIFNKQPKTGTDVVSQNTASGAVQSLSYWNLGLMSRDKNDRKPTVVPSSTDVAPVRQQKSATVMISSEGVNLLEVPVAGQDHVRMRHLSSQLM